MMVKYVLFLSFLFIIPIGAQAQSRLINCDTVFPYRGANYKYGLATVDRLIAEPRHDEIIMTLDKNPQNYYLFFNREDNKSGVVSHSGETLTSELPGLPESYYDYTLSGCIISYKNYQNELVVYSGCLKKLVGVYDKGKINLKPMFRSGFNSKTKKSARPDFVISAPDLEKPLEFNAEGRQLTLDNEDENVYCKGRYSYYYPDEYRQAKKSTANIEVYQSYFPEYEIIEEYYNAKGNISILATKENKYGLIDSKGTVVLPFQYQFIKYDQGVLIVKDGYKAIVDCYGQFIYDHIFTTIWVNDPKQGMFRVDTGQGCRGYCDFSGNIFLPSDCIPK